MNKRLLYIALLGLIPYISFAQFKFGASEKSPLLKLSYAEQMIKDYYVESVDENKLVEDGIRGIDRKSVGRERV
jgi:carboxyl-terminal processing protease